MVKSKPTSPASRRQGFTLVELLIVIAVIAILAALLVPSIGRGIVNTRNTAVKAEISQFDTAIASFKNAHSIEPPSSITLYETASDWNGTSTNTVNSRKIIQQLWPQFDFTKNRDFNNDNDGGANHESFTLLPAECLVLFLGGVYTKDPTTGLFSMIGFSKDPTDPLGPYNSTTGEPLATTGVAREAPLFQFEPARLIDNQMYDTTSGTAIGGSNGIPEYLDSLPSQKKPYLYYSSYDGVGYAETSTVEFSAGNSYLLATPYWQGTAVSPAAQRWKNSSHQIISPGYDGLYGYGGPYVTSGSNALPPAQSGAPTASNRNGEADNITNFSQGVLQP